MIITIDTDAGTLTTRTPEVERQLSLYSADAFRVISDQWLAVGWDQKYPYTFSWLGRPIIQLPEDMIRVQELIFELRPDVIIETGVAHGGSLIFYASLCKLLGTGRVVGIDVEIRPHNRTAISNHMLAPLVTLVEGDSVATDTVNRVRKMVGSDQKVLVLLDSRHTRAHVRKELEAYGPLVTPGSYIIATDGIMAQVAPTPRGKREWAHDNPISAAGDFLAAHPEFKEMQPTMPFNESPLSQTGVTHWPHAYLKRMM